MYSAITENQRVTTSPHDPERCVTNSCMYGAAAGLHETEDIPVADPYTRTQAGPDRTQAVADRTEAGPDRTQADPDRTQAGPDSTQAGPDRTQAYPNRTEAGRDRTQADLAAGGPAAGCNRLFRLSELRFHWESPVEWPAGCRSGTLGPKAVGRCLERRLARTGRRTSLVFVGDSRARIHFQKLQGELGLQPHGRPLAELFPSLFANNVTVKTHGNTNLCIGSTLMSFNPMTRVQRVACDLEATGPLLDAKFFWHTHMDGGYLARLEELTESCRSGGGCPDLVVLTDGMWYARIISQKVPLHERLLRFRRDVSGLSDGLRSLAQYTTVLYRLDGPELTESSGERSRVGGVLSAINAAAWEAVSRVSGPFLLLLFYYYYFVVHFNHRRVGITVGAQYSTHNSLTGYMHTRVTHFLQGK